jgi:polar amino acid transport system substrate-binding protein
MLSKKADVLAAPVAITSARDEVLDFSLPIMQAGLLIAVRDTGEPPSVNPLEDLLVLLFSKTMLVWLGIALALILIPAHLIWFLDRGSEGGVIENPRYIPGIFDAMYWAVSGLTSQAQSMPHQWVARVFSVFWMFAGVVFVAFYTAQLTTSLTVRQIQGSIGGPDDLVGKQVGALANTVAVDYLRSHNIQFQEFHRADPMLIALQTKRVDAVVFNAPMLLYYASHDGKGLVRIVGPEFYISPVAFGFQVDSALRRKVNQALLTLRENGTYQRLYDKWFGVQ